MTETRTIETELTIDAPPDVVWKALTDPQELTRWFPMTASVEPGTGGCITLGWGEEITGRNRILAWEPGRRLQTTWFEPAPGERPESVQTADPEAAARLVVDYHLEGRGGGTVLRLVHSGFSPDARWDDEFDGTRLGWAFELGSLKHYLENHRGRARHVAWVRHPIGRVKRAEAFARLLGPGGLVREGSIDGLRAGDRYVVTTAHGDRLEGEVRVNEAPLEFAGTVDNLDRAYMRCGVETCTGPEVAHLWLSTWSGPRDAEAFRARWTTTLAELFPA